MNEPAVVSTTLAILKVMAKYIFALILFDRRMKKFARFASIAHIAHEITTYILGCF